MKRIPSPLLLAAIPLLAPLHGVFSGSAADPAGLTAAQQRGSAVNGTQQGDQSAEEGDEAEDADEVDRPDGLGARDRDAYDVFGRRTRARAATFEERLQGGWRLTRLDLRNSNPRDRVAQGFMHIGANFLSMELHALWEVNTGSVGVPENDIHTTFTAEYQLDGSGKLYCQTVIGSYIDEETGELRWERGGFEREYTVREVRNEIELSFREQGVGESRLYFQPYIPKGKGQRNIFGKQQIGSFGATDIFGRPKAAGNGNTDIYGRPEKAPPAGEGAPGKVDLPPKGPGAGGGSPLSGRKG